jgi:hypothetical protein
MMTWIRNLMRRRRAPAAAPSVRTESLNRARREAARADEAFRWVEAQDQEVDERANRAIQIRRENNLGPAFMHVLKGHHDEGTA